jgi:hypothetical protein
MKNFKNFVFLVFPKIRNVTAAVELARTVMPGRSSPIGGSLHDWGKLAGAAMLGRGGARR